MAATPKKEETKPGGPFRLRAGKPLEELNPDSPRFHIFLVDTGWNAHVSRMLQAHVPLIHEFHPQDPIYVLSREQSVKVLKSAPEHIGLDPILVVYDLHCPEDACSRKKGERYRGFRLNLGLLKHPEQALHKLQQFLRFISCHRTSQRLDHEVQRELHKEGLGNMVNILREASEASLELI
jgi:hypothetical protein